MTTRLPKDERRKQLLSVALKLFAKLNFNQVTTARFAKEAGVTEPVLYQHFESKDELFREAVRESCSLMIDEWKRLEAQSSSALAALLAIGREQVHPESQLFVYCNVHLAALSEANEPDIATLLRECFQSFHRHIEALLLRAEAAGELKAVSNMSNFAWFLLSQLLMLKVQHRIGLTAPMDSGYYKDWITVCAGMMSSTIDPFVEKKKD